jgi:hypothetical protein
MMDISPGWSHGSIEDNYAAGDMSINGKLEEGVRLPPCNAIVHVPIGFELRCFSSDKF